MYVLIFITLSHKTYAVTSAQGRYYMMDIVVLIFLLFPLRSSICESKYQTFPLQFDLIMNRIRDYQYFESDELVDFPYTITRDRMSDYLSSLTRDQMTVCEQDFQPIIDGALQFDTWALKVVDAGGKLLLSGLLRGNLFWTGNYDECVEEMYLSDNKSFVPQPFDTQHCMYKYLFQFDQH